MGKYFGTDGIRGIVNAELDAHFIFDVHFAFKVGKAAAMILAKKSNNKRPLFTIGKDTRISCDMLEAAIIAGLCSAGADVMQLDVVPTPAVAFITKDCGADAGIVISASHNSYEYNGIKMFNSQGLKLSDELEAQIEEFIVSPPKELEIKHSQDIGKVTRGQEYVDRYVNHLVTLAEGRISGRLKVLIDCANGAATRTAKDVFGAFPLDFKIIADLPDGRNINLNCGSTHIKKNLSKMVVEGGFDLGIAFDGDADRCLSVDENGEPVDGDKMMAICGAAMMREGKLKENTIVATVMSNLGFHEYCRKNEIQLHCVDVGDRNVLQKMLDCGYNLGGEQSGHLIFLDDATTGDGQLAALRFLEVLSQSGKKLSELAASIPTYPQILLNVPINGGNQVKVEIMENKELSAIIEKEQKALGNSGRLLVRPSGTEALIRVMVESIDYAVAEAVAERLVEEIKRLAS